MKTNQLYAASIIFMLFSNWTQVNGANILGLFPTTSASHFIIQDALMRGLAAKGHNVSLAIELML